MLRILHRRRVVRNRGSVLIEHLLAISLLSLFIVSLFSLLMTGSLAAQAAQETSVAGGLAAQKLEEVGCACREPVAMPRSPVDPIRFPKHEWEVAIKEIGPALRQVTVTVWWPFRGRERQVSFTTLVRRQDAR